MEPRAASTQGSLFTIRIEVKLHALSNVHLHKTFIDSFASG